MAQVNKIGLYLYLALGRKEVLKRILREALKMYSKLWLQTIFTGLPLLFIWLRIETYVSLKCKNMKLDNLLRRILFPITSVDQTPYWKEHWLMSCESYPLMTYRLFLFFIKLDFPGTSWSGKLYHLFAHVS